MLGNTNSLSYDQAFRIDYLHPKGLIPHPTTVLQIRWVSNLHRSPPASPSMDGQAKEVSPEPSTRGLKGVLSKARRGGKPNASVVSINDNSSDSHGIRSSIDSSQYRASRGSSLDDGLPSNGSSGISKLLPKGIQKKRRERKAAKEMAKDEEEAQQEDGRGRSISEQAATAAAPAAPLQSGSRSTLAETGSLLTNDSDGES